MLPITGPFTAKRTAPWLTNQWALSVDRTWYRQRKPYDLPLPFEMLKRSIGNHPRKAGATTDAASSSGISIGTFKSRAFSFTTDAPTLAPHLETARTYARSRFSGKVKDSANLALMYLERREAMASLTSRLLQMARFTREVRQFQFRRAFNTLAETQVKDRKRLEAAFRRKSGRLKRSSKAFANNFLEYRFMWSATVADISSAVDILQGGVPPAQVRASFTSKYVINQVHPTSFRDYLATHTGSVRVGTGATIYVTNPNLWLANQLGFVNPAILLVERIPLSFVLNWFITVEEFLSQFTEFWGLNVSNPWVSQKVVDTSTWKIVSKPVASVNDNFGGNDCVHVIRTVGSLPGVSLQVRKPWKLSPTRALTAASLLVQRLK